MRTHAEHGTPPTNDERLARWEQRTRPAIIAAALIPLIGVTTTTKDYGLIGDLVEIACWLVFVADLVVHMRLRPGYLKSGYGKFDLAVVVLTSPWYLLPGVDAGQVVTLLRLARLARVAMVGFQAPVIRRTLQRLGRPFAYVGILLVVCSAIVMRAEHHEHGFKTFGDSLWWGIVTLTTVGYGDLVPESTVGRLTAVVLMLAGVALLGTVAASLASMFRLEDRATEAAGEPTSTTASTVPQGATSAGSATNLDAAAVTEELRGLRAEIAALREEIARRSPEV